MLGSIFSSSRSTFSPQKMLDLASSYLETACKTKDLEIALVLCDDAEASLSQMKKAVKKAHAPETLADQTLRDKIASVYFEHGKVLDQLGQSDRAQMSYKKAQKWGYEETKSAATMPVMSMFTNSAPAMIQAATSTAMSAQAKSDLVDYLFEKALLTLSSLKIVNNPSLFLVYAHDNPTHGKADAETSKYLIDKLFQIQGFKLHSDQAPMGHPYSSSPEELKKDGKLGDIVTNQLCLLPAQLIKEVKPVDKVVVCSSEVLASYLKWKDYEKFHQELQVAYHKDLEAYRNDNEQKDALAIRQVVNKFSQEEEYKTGFHHVLTEIAFLQIREKHMLGEHGIIPVSLTPNSYKKCLAHFIPATTVRIGDIPRLEGQAQAGREVHQNQSRHGVLFKLIERLLVGSNEAKTFLDKFWTGHSECISLLNKNSTLDALQFAKLLDGIFDGIQRAQHSQLASILNQQDQELWVIKADPIEALKEQYFSALTQNEAFQETLKLYVEPRCRASMNGESKTFELLPQVQAFLKDKQVILLTGDSGAGKSTLNRLLEKQLWEKREKQGAIPLFISLASIDTPEHDLISKALKKKGLSEFQIQTLKKEHQKFIFILDGYDEIRQTQNLYLSNHVNQSDGWQGQMVISCRSEYLGQDYRSRFQPNPNLKGEDPFFQEVVIEPFSEEERHRYLKKYVTHNQMGWAEQRYQAALEQPHLKDLVSNPFLLQVVLEALPHLENEGKARTAVQLRLDLYEHFVRCWFERNQQRLSTQDLKGSQAEIFRALCDDGFAEHGLAFVQDLAVHLYTENGGNPIIEYSLRKDKGNWKEAFFGREEEKQLLREAWPLIRSGNQYRLMHKSLLEYCVARALFEVFDACRALNTRPRRGSNASVYSFESSPVQPLKTLRDLPLSPKHWVEDLGVMRWLTERVQEEPSFKDQLFAIIERSKSDARVRQIAAHAMTILVKAGVQFNGADLQGIQIPGADLSFGIFDLAQLQGADLRRANLRNSWLSQANLSGAQMAGVQFGEWPSLQEESPVWACASSPDETHYAVGVNNGVISLYTTSDWQKIRTLSGHSDVVYSVAYSPAGDQLASGSKDTTIRLWDVASGVCAQTLSGHSYEVMSVAYSPTGDQLASGSKDTTIRLWDVASGVCAQTLSGHSGEVMSVAYSPTGGQLASGSEDYTVRLWDIESGVCSQTLSGHSGGVMSVTYSPTGDQLASGSSDATVRLWDGASWVCSQILSGQSHLVNSVIYLSKGAQLTAGSFDTTVRLWDVTPSVSHQALNGHSNSVWSVVYSPTGNQLASGSADNTVRLWDVTRGVCVQTLRGHSNGVVSVVYSPTGDQLASGSRDTTVRLWEGASGVCVQTLSGHSDQVWSVAYSPTGDQLASGSKDTTIRLWDVETGTCSQTLRGHSHSVHSVVYSPTGDQFASGSLDHTVRLWDVKTGTCSQTLRGHSHQVLSVAYSPTGDQLASSGQDGTVRLWDVKTGTCSQTLSGHLYGVRSVAYSPEVGLIASGSFDTTLRLWNVETGQCQRVISEFGGAVLSIACKATLKGHYWVTGSADHSVRQWQGIQEGETYNVRLCWSSTHHFLTSRETFIEGVQGLSPVNTQLLKQRGAVGEPPSHSREVRQEIIVTLDSDRASNLESNANNMDLQRWIANRRKRVSAAIKI